MTLPLVTVGIALYNHEKYIEKCLFSILEQTYDNIEIILIDDGSSDNSYQVAKQILENQHRYACIHESRPNKGMCHTLNEIIKKSSGEFISFIGSDDYWMPEKTSIQASFLIENKDLSLVHANSITVDGDDNITGEICYRNKKNSGNLFEAIIEGKGGVNTPAHLYRTAIYQQIGCYDPDFTFEDTDFWLRLTKVSNVGYIDTNLTYYRIHSNNYSQADNLLKFYNEEIVRIYRKNIDDPILKKNAILRMYRKSFLRAARKGNLLYSARYLRKILIGRCLGKV